MKMKMLTLLLFLLVSASVLSALPSDGGGLPLHVDARVIDAKTGERLPFASVYISGQNSASLNAEGEFVIDADSADVLRISYVGYKTVRLRAVDIGQEVLLSSEGEMLGEVVVLGTDLVVQNALKRMKKDNKRYRKIRGNYFYRQVGYTDRQCHSFLESFFTARSASQVSEMSLVTGRYLSVASMRTISPANFFTFAQVPVFSNQKNIPSTEQLVPLHRGYARDYLTEMSLVGDDERRVYVISFVPRDSNAWAIEGRLYVDAETFQLLKYEGRSTKEWVSHKVGNRAVVRPIDYSFVVNYQLDNGFAEVSSVHFRTSYTADGHKFETTGVMFNVADRYFTSRGTLRFNDNLMALIDRKGLDRGFWEQNEIVKRTPVEEEAVEIFEYDNLFGVF